MNPETLVFIESETLRANLGWSVGVVAAFYLLRFGALALTRKLAADVPEARRRWSIMIRNAFVGFSTIALIVIWREEIRVFALSLVAVAAAFAIATKEGILCFVGGLLRLTNHLYGIGDRIEIGSARGDVIDHNLMTTTLLEVGPQKDMHVYTGRTVVIPNSMLLTLPIVNESSNEYVLHVFRIPIAPGEDWRMAEQVVLEAARTECASTLEDARRRLSAIIKDHGLDSFNVDPRVSLHLNDTGKVGLVVRIPALNKKKAGMEQAILRTYLEAKLVLAAEGAAAAAGETRRAG